MRRIKLVVAYDGTNYHGWQFQTNGISIEEVLNQALSSLLKEDIVVIGASRTDSGVHALGNVAVFDTESRIPADKLCFALNQRLPEDIRVQSSCEVSPDWHPRKQNCVKTYEYKIFNRKVDMPVGRLYTYFCYFPLNEEAMRQAAAYLIGEHDFKSFCTPRTQAEETVRTIYQLSVERDNADVVTIRISGSGFLYNMVRIIAGTLLRVGTGLYLPEHVEEILEARNRQAAGPTLPAKGLTLICLEYEKELAEKITGTNRHWDYELIQAEVPEKKKAYLIIRRCEANEFDRLLSRVTHQAVRNGARQVYVCDKEADKESDKGADGRIVPGKAYGYYCFYPEHTMVRMEKVICGEMKNREAEEARMDKRETAGEQNEKPMGWETLDESEISSFCVLCNEIFYSVPNSATYTEKEIREWLADSRYHLFWIMSGKERAGFLILEEEDKELALESFGILDAFRRRGLAKWSLEQAQRMAERLGKEKLFLIVSDINRPAWTLYRAEGFAVVQTVSRWYAAEDADGCLYLNVL